MAEKIDKGILKQYTDLVEEIKDTRKRIKLLQEQLSKTEQEGSVIDTVKGGYGGIQSFKIEGFPYPAYTKKKAILNTRITLLQGMELELLELTNAVEEYIQSVEDSRMRRILRYRYIDCLSFVQVAINMGGKATEDSIRMEINRFLKN